jgi:hypothetical protein
VWSNTTTRAYFPQGALHGVDDRRVLAHRQIVIGAPDHDLLLGPVRAPAQGAGEPAAHALQVGEDPIAPLGLNLLDGGSEGGVIVEQSGGPAVIGMERFCAAGRQKSIGRGR